MHMWYCTRQIDVFELLVTHQESGNAFNASLMSHLLQLPNSLPVDTFNRFNLVLESCVRNIPQHRGGNLNAALGRLLCILAEIGSCLTGKAGYPG